MPKRNDKSAETVPSKSVDYEDIYKRISKTCVIPSYSMDESSFEATDGIRRRK